MRKFSLLLISTFALAVSIPISASSLEIVKDNDCGWVNYCPGKGENYKSPCPEGTAMAGGLSGISCVPAQHLE